MALTPGTRIGAYEVVALLGAGGMGEVYRAKDMRLKREVAIKVLPDAFASDPDRLARFQREAELLATLNHPNIGSVYGFEQSDPSTRSGQAVSAIVLELVEGETLADRIHRGAIPVKAALAIALQIAEALEAAHERGVIHRDLKPANIKITPDDKVKVLDFGLAKALSPDHGNGSVRLQADLTHSPTLSMMGTQAGMILGTAAYMSPEQAKGFPADQRSDVFAFGTVLYEMLTGRQPFSGDTAPDVLASVIVRDADLATLPLNLNPRLVDLLKRCLEKSPRKRWQAIGDVRAEIETIAPSPHSTPVSVGAHVPRPLWQRVVPIVATAAMTALAAIAIAYYAWPVVVRPVTRFVVSLPEEQLFSGVQRPLVTISSDGQRIAYSANRRLYVRSLNGLELTPIAGSDNLPASNTGNPVFSPDGQWLVFHAGDMTLKKISVSGGTPVMVCKLNQAVGYGLSWSEAGILFSQANVGIFLVSKDGGDPRLIAAVKPGQTAQGPRMLPDGRTLLFSLIQGESPDRWTKAEIVLQNVETGERKVLHAGGNDARYIRSGHIVYATGGVIYALPFDLRTLAVTGSSVPVIEGVRRTGNTVSLSHLAISDTGTVAFVPGPTGLAAAAVNLAMFDRKGIPELLKIPAGPYRHVRLSPDKKRVAFDSDDDLEANVQVYDLSGATTPRRLTFGGFNRFPTWSFDSQRIMFASNRDGHFSIYAQRADGTGGVERLTTASQGASHMPESASRDGNWLLYSDTPASGKTKLMLLSLKDRTATSFGGVEATSLTSAAFSPNGRWVAYSGTGITRMASALFVQPFPADGTTIYQLTKDRDAHHASWSADGTELSFVMGAGVFATVNVRTLPSFDYSEPSIVPLPGLQGPPTVSRNFDRAPDGTSYVGFIPEGGDAGRQIHVILNWFEELKQRAPTMN